MLIYAGSVAVAFAYNTKIKIDRQTKMRKKVGMHCVWVFVYQDPMYDIYIHVGCDDMCLSVLSLSHTRTLTYTYTLTHGHKYCSCVDVDVWMCKSNAMSRCVYWSSHHTLQHCTHSFSIPYTCLEYNAPTNNDVRWCMWVTSRAAVALDNCFLTLPWALTMSQWRVSTCDRIMWVHYVLHLSLYYKRLAARNLGWRTTLDAVYIYMHLYICVCERVYLCIVYNETYVIVYVLNYRLTHLQFCGYLFSPLLEKINGKYRNHTERRSNF